MPTTENALAAPVVLAAIITAVGGILLSIYSRRQERKANAPGSFRADMLARLQTRDEEAARQSTRISTLEAAKDEAEQAKFWDRLYIQMLLNHIWQGNPPPPPQPPAGFVP